MVANKLMQDVVIVGAGPAGSVAAIVARRRGLSVLVVERHLFPRPRAFTGWLTPAAVQFSQKCGVDLAALGGAHYQGLRLHSWDLKRSVSVDDADLSGWIVERSDFDAALLKQAQAEGAAVRFNVVPEALNLGEEAVTIRLSDGHEVRGQVLLIADGADSPTARLANLATAQQNEGVGWCAHATFTARKPDGGLDVVIGSERTHQLVTIVRAGGQFRATLMTHERATPAEQQLAGFLRSATESGLVPGPPLSPIESYVCLAGVALDMDQHVGKRCLLIGDAGGFVAAFSNEGVYPAMKSGWIAAETAARAVAAPVLQDELASFSAVWRAELADYLRMPNTDLALLMPLVFNNPQMSRRVARAFLLGQAF